MSFDFGMEKMEEFKKAATNFRDSVADQHSRLKDMSVEMKDWRFGMESNDNGLAIDVTVKLLVKPKPK